MRWPELAHPVAGPRLLIDIADHADEVLLGLVGELDIYTASLLRRDLEPFERPGVSRLVIDLSGVSFLDSAGIRALVGARDRLRRVGARLGLICPRRLTVVLRAGGLASAFVLGEDLSGARAALAPRAGTWARGSLTDKRVAWARRHGGDPGLMQKRR